MMMSASIGPRRALIVTGEASGDLLGAQLIRAAAELDPGLNFFGVGGNRMEEAGCEILIPGEELAVMGLVEVIGHFPTIWRAFQRLKGILHGPRRPDLLILIDFPDFNLRLARQAKKAGVPVLYYVSPQVWAWRRSRVKKIAAVVDRLAALFPFEPAYYQGLDIDVEYVGHPLLDEFEVRTDRRSFLERLRIDPALPVIGLFPGSRRSELKYMFATILETAEVIRNNKPEAVFLLPVAASLDLSELQALIGPTGLPITMVRENIYDTAAACDAVVTVSGTVTLQTALAGTPMAIFYKMSPFTYALAKRLVKTSFIGLANIVAGEAVVREFIQEQASAKELAAEVLRILDDSDYNRRIRQGLAEINSRMGEPGSSRRVATMASEMSRGLVRKGGR